jgi:hypothetical protein
MGHSRNPNESVKILANQVEIKCRAARRTRSLIVFMAVDLKRRPKIKCQGVSLGTLDNVTATSRWEQN